VALFDLFGVVYHELVFAHDFHMSSTDEPASKRKRTELDDESTAKSGSKEPSSTTEPTTASETVPAAADSGTAESTKVDLEEWDGYLYPLIKLMKQRRRESFAFDDGSFKVSLSSHSGWLTLFS
jgi:hypothetical protein